jgi:hypothetical protein
LANFAEDMLAGWLEFWVGGVELFRVVVATAISLSSDGLHLCRFETDAMIPFT